MPKVTIEEREIVCYNSGSVWNDGNYLGLGNGRYNLRIELDLPRGLEDLEAYVSFRVNTSDAPGYNNFYATLTQEEGNRPPEVKEAVYKFSESGNRAATFKVVKKLRKGKWFLWLWSDFSSVREILNGITSLELTGAAAGTGHIYRNGLWRDSQPMVYKNGAWREATAGRHDEEWSELS